jgi:two-component sensor histidine kinase
LVAPIEAHSGNANRVQSTKSNRRVAWEAADTIVAATVALLVVVFAIFGFLVWQAFGNSVTQASTRAERAADVLSERTSFVVGSALGVLDVVSRTEGLPGAIAPGDLAHLSDVVSRLPAVAGLGVYDAEGRAASDEPGLPSDISVASYFERLWAGEEWIIDPLPDTSDFVIGRRISRNGNFEGALVLRLDHAMLSSFWSLMDFGAGSTVSIIRDDGIVIARHPPLDASLSLAGRPAFTSLTAADSGSYVSESSPADGVSRIVGFQHVPNLGLIAVASLTTEATRAGIWTSTGIVLALLGPIGLALLVGSLATARVLRRSESNRRELAAALTHNEVLFKEIHHRVKNNLQSVNSLLQLQPIPKDIRREMGRRITAMSAVHEHIYRSGNFDTVGLSDYLRTLLRDIETGQVAKIEISEHLEDLSIEKDVATPLALIVNEVLSNAFKHAFTDGREGKLSLTLRRDQSGLGHLTITDNGQGFDSEQPSNGIGRKLIAALTQQIAGSSSYTRDNGTRFDLTFPLALATQSA